MANVDAILKTFFEDHLALSAKDIQECAKSREWLLKRISNVIASTDGPQLFASEPFVNFGSYFKGTKVADVDEYDVLVVIDSCTGQFTESGVVTGTGKGSCNPNKKYRPEFYKTDGSGISPNKLLDWLKGIVEKVLSPLGGETPIRDGQAITALLKSQDIKIDLVPAGVFDSTQTEGKVFYNIPKGDGNDSWLITNPKKDKELIEAAATDRADFRNIIRLAKLVRDFYGEKFSSFLFECQAVWYVANKDTTWSTSTTVNLIGYLDSLADALEAGEVFDITATDKNLIEDKERAKNFAVTLRYIAVVIKRQLFEEDAIKAKNKIYAVLLNKRELARTGSL